MWPPLGEAQSDGPLPSSLGSWCGSDQVGAANSAPRGLFVLGECRGPTLRTARLRKATAIRSTSTAVRSNEGRRSQSIVPGGLARNHLMGFADLLQGLLAAAANAS